jgi:hypothetical protein
MARCGCSGASCSCFIIGQGGVTVTGAGSQSNQYVISSDINVDVLDTSTVNMSKTGDGSPANPWTFSSVATVTLDQLTDVDTVGGATGYVLARNAGGTYGLVPASTAPVGTVNVGDGLQGDASAGNKLRILLAPSSGLPVGPTGLALAGGGTAWTTYTPVWTASTTNPVIGNGTIKGYYAQTGKTVHFSVEIMFGSSTTRGVGNHSISLPVPPATTRRQVSAAQVARYGVCDYGAIASINAGKIERIHLSTSTNAQPLSHSVPATMPSGSIVFATGTYEAA